MLSLTLGQKNVRRGSRISRYYLLNAVAAAAAAFLRAQLIRLFLYEPTLLGAAEPEDLRTSHAHL